MKYQSIDYQKLQAIVKKAGKLLLEYYNGAYQVHTKGDHSVYTDADIASEQLLSKELTALFPAQVWAEESGQNGVQGDYCWVIDPLDGTRNFSRGLPYFCVSVALTYQQKVVVAVVYQPLTDELFFATKKHPTTCNGKQIIASQKKDLSDTVIGISSWGHLEEHQVSDILKKRTVIRRHGAIALDLAYVAAGKLDAFFYIRAYWWDVAAGRLLIEQAGGKLTPMGPIAKNGKVGKGIAAGEDLFDSLATIIKVY